MPWSGEDRSRSESAADRSVGIERILSRGEIRVALTGNQPPFNMTTKQGELIGLEVALENTGMLKRAWYDWFENPDGLESIR